LLAALTIWLRRDVRRNWRGLALLAVAVAVGLGFAMVAAIGARRTGSAWDRFVSRSAPPDVIGEVPIDQLVARKSEVSERAGVTDVAAFAYMSMSYEGYEPAEGWRTLGAFVGLTPSFLRTLYSPLILEGRATDPERADELTINEAAARITGLRPGDDIVLTSEPAVVRQHAVVVGIHRGPFDVGLNGNQPGLLLTPAFGRQWFAPYLDALPADLRSGFTGG
jgi:putative ABC transport system permease protein